MNSYTADNVTAHARTVAILTTLTMVLFCLVVALRVFAKVKLMRTGFLWDDGFILAAVFCAVPFCIFNLLINDLHKSQILLAARNEALTDSETHIYHLLIFLIGPFSLLVHSFTELSILSLYHRLSAPATSFRGWTIGVAVFCTLRNVAAFISLFVQCTPMEKVWEIDMDGKCIDKQALLKALTMLQSMTSFAVYVLPIRHIWSLQMSRKKKSMVTFVFAFGGVSCILGLVRVIKVWRSIGDVKGTPGGAGAGELLVNDLLLTVLELGTALICASLPALRAYFKILGPRFRGFCPSGPSIPSSRAGPMPKKPRYRLYTIPSKFSITSAQTDENSKQQMSSMMASTGSGRAKCGQIGSWRELEEGKGGMGNSSVMERCSHAGEGGDRGLPWDNGNGGFYSEARGSFGGTDEELEDKKGAQNVAGGIRRTVEVEVAVEMEMQDVGYGERERKGQGLTLQGGDGRWN